MFGNNAQFASQLRESARPRARAIRPDPASLWKPLYYLVLFGLLILILLHAAFVSKVSAHALLVKSEPANESTLGDPPSQVTAWFSQELDSSFSTMRVIDEDGGQVDAGDGRVDLNDIEHKSMIVTLPETLPAGSYTVLWSVVSAEDGDLSEGEFVFGVGGVIPNQQPSLQPETEDSPFFLPLTGLTIIFLVAGIVVILFRRQRAAQPEEQLTPQN